MDLVRHGDLWVDLVEIQAAKRKDPRLRLVYPLVSRKVLTWRVEDLGNTMKPACAVLRQPRSKHSSEVRWFKS